MSISKRLLNALTKSDYTVIKESQVPAHYSCIVVVPANVTYTGIPISSAYFKSELAHALHGAVDGPIDREVARDC